MRRFSLFVCVLAAFTFSTPTQAKPVSQDALQATSSVLPGNVDAGFGTNGSVTLPIYYPIMAEQSDGKLVFAGYDGPMGVETTRVAVVRLNSNGTVDSSFGDAGIAKLPLQPYTYITSVDVEQNGNIIIGARRYVGNSGYSVFIIGVTKDGLLDATFGTNGMGAFLDGNSGESISTVKRQSTGKLLVEHYYNSAFGKGAYGVSVARLNINGTLDKTFGENGRLPNCCRYSVTNNTLRVRSDDTLDVFYTAAVYPVGPLPDGYLPIVYTMYDTNGQQVTTRTVQSLDITGATRQGDNIIGYRYLSDDIRDKPFVLRRILLDGTVDPYFGSHTTFGTYTNCPSSGGQVGVADDGTYTLVSGFGCKQPEGFYITRYTANGDLLWQTIVPYASSNGIFVQSNGKTLFVANADGDTGRSLPHVTRFAAEPYTKIYLPLAQRN